jgi:hypothetical protein
MCDAVEMADCFVTSGIGKNLLWVTHGRGRQGSITLQDKHMEFRGTPLKCRSCRGRLAWEFEN